MGVATFTIANECDPFAGAISKTFNITWGGTLVSCILAGQVSADFAGIGGLILSVQVNGNEVAQVQPTGGGLTHAIADVSGINITSLLLQGANIVSFVWLATLVDVLQTCATVQATANATGSITPPPPPVSGWQELINAIEVPVVVVAGVVALVEVLRFFKKK